MAAFAGWDPKELKSRVDVIKHICWYIKSNQLDDNQLDDKSQIIFSLQNETK